MNNNDTVWIAAIRSLENCVNWVSDEIEEEENSSRNPAQLVICVQCDYCITPVVILELLALSRKYYTFGHIIIVFNKFGFFFFLRHAVVIILHRRLYKQPNIIIKKVLNILFHLKEREDPNYKKRVKYRYRTSGTHCYAAWRRMVVNMKRSLKAMYRRYLNVSKFSLSVHLEIFHSCLDHS